MSAVQSRSNSLRWVYAAAWLPWLAMYAAALVANGIPLGFAARNAVANVLPDALLGLAVLRLPRRLPWPEERRARFFAAHGGALAAFLIASAAGWALLVGLDELLFKGSFAVHLNPRVVPFRALNDALIYCTLAGISYAWNNAAARREQAALAARAEALRARAELAAMRSQLNPHFILNTFHALVGLVRREPAIAEESLERLGDLLRYSLRIHRLQLDEVELREEWSFVQSYLDLERLRLGDRLRLSLDAPASTLSCMVPCFALQTLVENAIRHAVAPRAAGGCVTVSARQVAERLCIQVEDEGAAGAAPAEPASDDHGLGLRLLQERLAALHRGAASLTLVATAAGGVRAVLDLPARQAREAT